MNKLIEGWMDGWTDIRKDGWMSGQMADLLDGWIDGRRCG